MPRRSADSINSVNTAGSTAVPFQYQPDSFLSVRAGVIMRPTPAQSYYVSYSTSFNRQLEQLTSTTGGSYLPPENNKGVRRVWRYELLNANLSLNAAVFSIVKNNARNANPGQDYRPATYTGERRPHRVCRPHHAGAGRCSAATPI